MGTYAKNLEAHNASTSSARACHMLSLNYALVTNRRIASRISIGYQTKSQAKHITNTYIERHADASFMKKPTPNTTLKHSALVSEQ